MGIPEVTGILVANGATENEVLQNAAIAEQPKAKRLVRRCEGLLHCLICWYVWN
jgi:hypothetical protein